MFFHLKICFFKLNNMFFESDRLAALCGRTSVKTCSLKSMALQMPSYSKHACNIVKIGGRLFTHVFVQSHIHLSVQVFVTLPRLGHISYHFNDSRTLQYTQILICQMINLSGRFHTVSFKMQSHDQNSTSSLKHV